MTKRTRRRHTSATPRRRQHDHKRGQGRGGQAARTGPDQDAPPAPSRIRSAINVVLCLVIVSGLIYLVARPDSSVTPRGGPARPSGDRREADTSRADVHVAPSPASETASLPPLSYETTGDGVRIARIDTPALTQWCRSVGLPDPPGIDRSEPAVAEALMAALGKTAAKRSALNYARVGRICYAIDAYQCAIAYLTLAARSDPRDYRWPYYLGCVHQAIGEPDEARRALTTALGLNDRYPMLHARLGQLYLDVDRLDEAESHFRRYAELRPEDWLGNVGLGRVALKRRDYNGALRRLQAAVAQAPDDFQAHYYLGKTYAALGQPELARTHFDKVSLVPRGRWLDTRDPLLQEGAASVDSAAVLTAEFERLRYSGNWDKLIELAEQIVQRRPGDTIMLVNLASLYRTRKRFADAHAALDRATRINPDLLSVHVARAEVYLAQGKYEEARRTADSVLRRDQASAGAYNVLGRALFSLNRQDQAESAMRKAVELDPMNANKAFVLGEILRNGGKTDEAVAWYKRTLELAPRHPLAAQRLAQLDRDR